MLPISSAADALKWLVEALLKIRERRGTKQHEKWLQVAQFLETLSEQINAALADFETQKLPWDHYHQLCSMAEGFYEVLGQVLGDRTPEQKRELHMLSGMLEESLQLIKEADVEDRIEKEGRMWDSHDPRLYQQLQSAAGQFRGVAARFRALA